VARPEKTESVLVCVDADVLIAWLLSRTGASHAILVLGELGLLDSVRSGRVKYRKMTPNADLKTRTYGCLAIITGTAVYEVTAGGQDRTVPLRFTAIWAKRSAGIEFVSWQSTGIPQQQ